MPYHSLPSGESGLPGLWKVTESIDELAALIPSGKDLAEDSSRLFHSESRRKEWLATRVLLHAMLGVEKEIGHLENGKPFLKNDCRHISISHTKGYVAIILGTQAEVGVDIEYRSPRVMKVKERFVSQQEEQNIRPEHELDSLLLHWCAKETAFKMMNTDGVDFVEHLHITEFDYPDKDIFMLQETRTALLNTFEIHYCVQSDFVLTWSEKIVFPYKIDNLFGTD